MIITPKYFKKTEASTKLVNVCVIYGIASVTIGVSMHIHQHDFLSMSAFSCVHMHMRIEA
jgi:formate hydrogenlyase subunit 3/multisubunit Na+/H+ antiporter MnhD subunit